ncbi:replication initiation protein [Azospirillum agricola]|uniref:replication initiation protein n=1 Tax=Azospirillum agricola TaxID=1720247 RepID=UPI000A0F1677|nr:replication initiation protein [Azospirillum agricola]SMH61582.1 Primase C terminal 1 (PriCT-1) [Azospirillum lipoferum]
MPDYPYLPSDLALFASADSPSWEVAYASNVPTSTAPLTGKTALRQLNLSRRHPRVQEFWDLLPEMVLAFERPLTRAEARAGLKASFKRWKWRADWAAIPGVGTGTPAYTRFVVVDCDHADVDRWRICGLPAPFLTIVNGEAHPEVARRGYHHHIWLLEAGVALGRRARAKPRAFLGLVRRALAITLDGDLTFAAAATGRTVKNPLHPSFDVLCWPEGKTTTLSDLASHADIELALETGRGPCRCGAAEDPDSRNVHLFNTVRELAYAEVRERWEEYHGAAAKEGCWRVLEDLVRGWLEEQNTFAEPLPTYEIAALARSITRFCRRKLQRRADTAIRPHRGIMNVNRTLPPADRMAAGGRFAAAQRRQTTYDAIEACVQERRAAGLPVSVGTVAAALRMAERTVQRHLKSVVAALPPKV